jgi:hypothetical protein
LQQVSLTSDHEERVSMEDWLNSVPEEESEHVKQLYAKAGSFKEKAKVLMDWHPKAYANLEPIRNLEEYFKYTRLTTNEHSWFRGESREYGDLTPKLYRGISDDRVTEQHRKERDYYLEFRRRARSLAPEVANDDTWSWYFLIQHYGGPTRLLDWTQDAAIALFFALGTDQDSKENAIVTVVNAPILVRFALDEIGWEKPSSDSLLYPGGAPSERWIANITGPTDVSKADIPDSPVAILPPYSDPRITAQRSCFTLFGKRTRGFVKDGKLIVCPACGQRIFHRLVIDGHERKRLRRELARIGIASGKVYPGLDGLAKEIAEEIFGG